ncbi:MAG: hypothetical protein ACREM2_06915 [Vulcanimicrobiaceae bacterium]
MKRLVSSRTYGRWRAANGSLFVVCGAAIAIRTAMIVGASPSAIPAYVLGAALVALGIVRIRGYLRSPRS